MKDVLEVLGLMVCFVAIFYLLKTFVIGWDPNSDKSWFWAIISAILFLASAPVFLLAYLFMQKGHDLGRQEISQKASEQNLENLRTISKCNKQIEKLKKEMSDEYEKGYGDGFRIGKNIGIGSKQNSDYKLGYIHGYEDCISKLDLSDDQRDALLKEMQELTGAGSSAIDS